MSISEAVLAPTSSSALFHPSGIQDHTGFGNNMASQNDSLTALMVQQIHQRQAMINHLQAALAAHGQRQLEPRQGGMSQHDANPNPDRFSPWTPGNNDDSVQSSTVPFVPGMATLPPLPSVQPQLQSPPFLSQTHATPPSVDQLDMLVSAIHAAQPAAGLGGPTDLDTFGLAQLPHHRTAPTRASFDPSHPTTSIAHFPVGELELDFQSSAVLDELHAVLMSDETPFHDDNSSRSSTAQLDDSAYTLQSVEPISRSAPPPPARTP
jgi:hypothetical protein